MKNPARLPITNLIPKLKPFGTNFAIDGLVLLIAFFEGVRFAKKLLRGGAIGQNTKTFLIERTAIDGPCTSKPPYLPI